MPDDNYDSGGSQVELNSNYHAMHSQTFPNKVEILFVIKIIILSLEMRWRIQVFPRMIVISCISLDP